MMVRNRKNCRVIAGGHCSVYNSEIDSLPETTISRCVVRIFGKDAEEEEGGLTTPPPLSPL